MQTALPEAADSAPAAPSSAGAAGGASSGASGGGGEAFDPYAGAAPVRREAGQASAGALELDKAALEAIRKLVGRSLASGHGTAQAYVRVSPAGIVVDAAVTGGTASPQAKAALRRTLLGKRLFSAGGSAADARMVSLPLLQLTL